jgi:nucleoside-diphosphate-sugar epimerase
MRVLVTGAAGFIGKPLCNLLMQQGHDVLGWDLPDHDITQPCDWRGQALDAVLHLAAIASPPLCDKDPALAFRVNVLGTHNMLKLAVAAGAKRFVLASSAHVYGISPLYLPTDERAPRSVFDTYTTTKLLSEHLCQLFWDNYGLSYASIRLFNGYGPGQQLGYFIADKIQQAKAGNFELRGHQVTKDWVYIDDVARAYCLALQSPFVGVVNIGTGIETNLETIAKRIAHAFGVELNIQKTSSQPTRMCADRHRAEQVLGWKPEVSLEEGIARTIKG